MGSASPSRRAGQGWPQRQGQCGGLAGTRLLRPFPHTPRAVRHVLEATPPCCLLTLSSHSAQPLQQHALDPQRVGPQDPLLSPRCTAPSAEGQPAADAEVSRSPKRLRSPG